MPQDRPLVTLAVLTFKRPDDLAVVLPRLVAQAFSVRDRATVDVVVVDNDPAAGARDVVEEAARTHADAAPVRYFHEPEPGISAGRNRALIAADASDLLVFIDDDERPIDGWLGYLLDTYAEGHPAAVAGPVESEFPGPVDPWIIAGGFFNRLRPPTGTRRPVAATNNLLLDLAVVRAHGLRFDPAFGLTGGGDTMFTKQLVAAGGTIVWCDEALVYDRVPESRLTRKWVLQRALRSGNSWSLTSIRMTSSLGARAVLRVGLTGRGLVRLGGGALRIGGGAVSGNTGLRARGFRTLMRGAGLLSGAWGYRYGEYRRPATSTASR